MKTNILIKAWILIICWHINHFHPKDGERYRKKVRQETWIEQRHRAHDEGNFWIVGTELRQSYFFFFFFLLVLGKGPMPSTRMSRYANHNNQELHITCLRSGGGNRYRKCSNARALIVPRELHRPRALTIHAFYIAVECTCTLWCWGRIADTTPVRLTLRVWSIAKQKCVHSRRERGVGKDSWGGFSISWCWRLWNRRGTWSTSWRRSTRCFWPSVNGRWKCARWRLPRWCWKCSECSAACSSVCVPLGVLTTLHWEHTF